MSTGSASIETLALGVTSETLGEEVERYLGAVAFFRSLGCEPTWASEAPSVLGARVWTALGTCEQHVSDV